LQYSGIIDEHMAVRTSAGMFDVSHMVLAGEDSANFMAELYRTMRKFNCAVWAITQDISDIENSPVAGAIMTNTYRYIVLRQINERAVQP